MWDNTPLTSKHVDALNTWKKHNPGWIRQLWTKKELKQVLDRRDYVRQALSVHLCAYM